MFTPLARILYTIWVLVSGPNTCGRPMSPWSYRQTPIMSSKPAIQKARDNLPNLSTQQP